MVLQSLWWPQLITQGILALELDGPFSKTQTETQEPGFCPSISVSFGLGVPQGVGYKLE